jgi:hypothetical protein
MKINSEIWKELIKFFDENIKNKEEFKDVWMILHKLKTDHCFRLVANLSVPQGIKNSNFHNCV